MRYAQRKISSGLYKGNLAEVLHISEDVSAKGFIFFLSDIWKGRTWNSLLPPLHK